MSRSAQWYMDISGKIFEGIASHTNPEIGKYIEETEGLEGPDLGFLQVGYALSPDPMTVKGYISRGPYTNPSSFETQMDESVERGWLEKTKTGQYKLTDKGLKTVQHFLEKGYQLFSDLPALPKPGPSWSKKLIICPIRPPNPLWKSACGLIPVWNPKRCCGFVVN